VAVAVSNQTEVELSEAVLGSDASERERALIEQLIAATRLYESSEAVKELMAFAIRLRIFAPFNAMLLHIQKPGLTHAASAGDWHKRFGRVPKEGARPMLILRTMGPIDFVFDILDTEGNELPPSAFLFPTLGSLSESRLSAIIGYIAGQGIEFVELDVGDARAGWIRLSPRSEKGKLRYQLGYNRNHPPETRIVTIAHELAHLHLGHLGEDKARSIRDRRHRTYEQCELEAEMVAFLVAKRNGLTPLSESYLANYKGAIKDIDLYSVMRVANAVETAMGVAAHQLIKKNLMGASA
jgi:IrrE N-terminal-like domain